MRQWSSVGFLLIYRPSARQWSSSGFVWYIGPLRGNGRTRFSFGISALYEAVVEVRFFVVISAICEAMVGFRFSFGISALYEAMVECRFSFVISALCEAMVEFFFFHF